MKRVELLIMGLIIFITSCKEEPKDYVTLSGIISNQNSDSLRIQSKEFKKVIKVNDDGTFKDTLNVIAGKYRLYDGKESTSLYLKNGYELKLTLNTKNFDETILYNGIGAEVNNYLAKKSLVNERVINYDELMALNRTSFDKKLNSAVKEFESLLETTKNLDSAFVSSEKKSIEMMSKQLTNLFKERQAILAMNGKGSPKFVDYENYAGGNTSLDDLKGKYVYIDMWATWCGPCKREIPFLKKVEKTYHDKNIAFVSISVDKEKDYEKWRTMVEEKELTGIQLYAKQDETFSEAYKVNGIPRFILIDPQGNIVDADAPRPSSEKLIKLFNDLKI